jgi:hypothetical protein
VSVPVSDPFGAGRDPALPFLAEALDPTVAHEALRESCPRWAGEGCRTRLRAIRVTRHKPGRRCLVEYDLEVWRPDAPPATVTLVGKARAKGLDESAYRVLCSLWHAGFGPDSADGIHVPEPVGVVPVFRMWLQRKVPGVPATRLLQGPAGVALARRVAEAIHKVHQAGVPRARRHTPADEMAILTRRLERLAGQEPRWARRLGLLLGVCADLAASIPEPEWCGVHRDFYPEQVLVHGSSLHLLDFDLCAEGDPGLDAGNFLGHLTEQALRRGGRADALAEQEAALEERFVELSGEAVRPAVRAYAALTLARHVSVSTEFPERRPFTHALLEICEDRVSSQSSVVRCRTGA